MKLVRTMILPQPDNTSKFKPIDSGNIRLSYNTVKVAQEKHKSANGDSYNSVDLKLMKTIDPDRKKKVDRRAHKRFAAKRGAFALIGSNLRRTIRIQSMSMGEIAFAVLKSKFSQMGRINNISKEGIAFCYIDSNVRPDETSELTILMAESRFYLYNISFNIISDFEIADELLSGPMKIRQLSLQFKGLTNHRISRLGYFIKNHTIGIT